MGNKFFWVYIAVVRLIFRPCVGNHPMGVRFVARNHPMGVRFVARNHPMGVRFVARNHPTGVRFAARNHPTAPERMSFRFVARNHPSVTFGDSSPLGEPSANLGSILAPLEGSSGESR